MKKFALKLTYILAFSFFLVSCADDYDDNPTSASINDFIWNGLNTYYYWLEDSPDLADTRFSSANDYYTFLENYNTPEALFNHLLYQKGTVDQFSVLYPDYTILEQALTGNSGSNGMEYKLYQANNSDVVYGVVSYILPNSDASTKNLERGDLFYAINGINLNINNFSDLLSQDSYTLNMGYIQNNQIFSNGQSVSLTKNPYSENPVYLTQTFDVGTKKVGYLVYNGFYSAYEPELNSAFAYFASEGITHLVLDLRYNGGGSVATATRLASMITGQFNNQIFAKQQWNYKLADYFADSNPERIINRFTNTLSDGTSINSLSLNSVYIITSKSTASASELVINGLKPYIDVVQIGTTTRGKNVGSVTLYDSPSYLKENLNPNHKYAMQPIVFKVANANDFSDYASGIVADINQNEDPANFGVLGTATEPLLETALNYIETNGRLSTPYSNTTSIEITKSISPIDDLETEMYIN